MKKTLIVQAPAKINIGLWVKNKRPDGFHELDTFFQTISLMDSITLHESFEEGIRVSCNNKNVPVGEDNIAFRAARLFLQKVGIEPALDIHIEKRIPMAAGLAGGSTDAAAVLTGLARLYERTITPAEFMEMAAFLGSDVPFLIRGGLARGSGRGEKLEFYEQPKNPITVVIVMPNDVSVSTKWCYENYTPSNNELKARSFEMILEAFQNRNFACLKRVVFNDLESVTLQRYPIIQKIKELLASTGDGVVLMSGSGPAVFGLFDTKQKALFALKALKGLPIDVYIEHTCKKNRV